MDYEPKREGANPPEGIAERALAAKSAWKPAVVLGLLLGFIVMLGVHFYSQRKKSEDTRKTAGSQAMEPGSEKPKIESSYANLERFLPLKEGSSWEFINVRTRKGNTYEANNIVTSLNLREINGKRTMSVRHDFIKSGTFSDKKAFVYLFYVIENDSIYISAIQTAKDKKPRVYSEPVYVIKTPIKVGTSWENRANKGVIESINETVTVPAGTFNGCIRLKLTFKKNITITWIAPGIGYVKKIFQYGDDDQAVEQLVSYKK